MTDHLDLASPVFLSDEPLHVCCPINTAALSFPCIRVRLYRRYKKLHKYLGKTPRFFSFFFFYLWKAVFFPWTNEIKAACSDFFAFSSIYQAKHLVNKTNGLPVGMHNSAIPQTSPVLAAEREKHGGQNCISLCVPALFSRLGGLPPKRAYRGSQTEKTDTFICLNLHPTLPSFHPAVFFPPSVTKARAPELNKAVSTN